MSQCANDLPKFDGQVARLSTWLRALRQAEHRLPDDVAFFVRTGARVNSNGTVSVSSVRHALLLHHGLLEQCGFGITLPPPVADRFDTLYNDIRSENAGFTAGGIALPETTEALPDALAASFLVRPYAIGAINLKLRDLLLSLIARRDYYKFKLSTASSASGELLMKALLLDLESSAHACALDASILHAKNRLDELASTVLNSPDPKEFTSLRDELTELMLELPTEQRLTSSQIFHIYESAVARLNMPFISFQAKNLLTLEQKRAFDHESYSEAITQVLSEQHLEDQQRARSNKAASRTATAAAFAATGSSSANAGDPRRFSRAACSICGKNGHTADACFQNANATCERSKQIAPLNTALGRRVASEKRSASSRTRRGSRVPPRTTQSPTPVTAP